MKTDYWIILTAFLLFLLGAIFNSSLLNFLGGVAIITEIGYTLIRTI